MAGGKMKFKNKAWILGKLILTTASQAEGAPFIDSACIREESGKVFKGILIHTKPFSRNAYGDRLGCRGIVIGWLR